MKSIILVLLAAVAAPAAEFSTGQAARLVIGQRTFTDGAPGADQIQVGVRIHLRPDGYVVGPAEIDNPRPNDAAWRAAADSAARAARAADYRSLPPAQLRLLADRGEIYFKIDEKTACAL